MAIGNPVTGGTTGSVLFIDGSGNLAQANSQFKWDYTNAAATQQLLIQSGIATNRVLVVKGFSGQTANLQEWQNSSGAVQASIGASGGLTAQGRVINAGIGLSTFISDVFGYGAGINLDATLIGGHNLAVQCVGGTGYFNVYDATLGVNLLTVGPTIFQIGSNDITLEGANWNKKIGFSQSPFAAHMLGIAPGDLTVALAFTTYSGSETEKVRITGAGLVGINTTAPGAQLHVVTSTSSTKGIIVQGAASQTANLQEWQNNSSSVLSSILPSGDITTQVAGIGFRIKEGSNARMGVGTLSGGTATISNTSVTANTRVFLSDTGGGITNLGALTSTVSAGS